MVKFVVRMVESERGWGQSYWDAQFDTLEEAEAYKKKVNAQNTSDTAPDYYIQAGEITRVPAS